MQYHTVPPMIDHYSCTAEAQHPSLPSLDKQGWLVTSMHAVKMALTSTQMWHLLQGHLEV